MRTRTLFSAILISSLASLAGCGDTGDGKPAKPETPPTPPPATVPLASQPDRVVIDHILIGVKQPHPRMAGFLRNEKDAGIVAKDLFAKLKAGGDWAAAKREYSEDPPPGGPYAMANSSKGVQPASGNEFPRASMAGAFGDVGFSLQVGEIGLAGFDPDKPGHMGSSPFGYHIIKRIQ